MTEPTQQWYEKRCQWYQGELERLQAEHERLKESYKMRISFLVSCIRSGEQLSNEEEKAVRGPIGAWNYDKGVEPC